MQLKKRIGTLILAVMVLISSLPANLTVMADDDKNTDVFSTGFENSEEEGQYKSSGAEFEIKDGLLTVKGDGVVGLKDYIWYNATYEFDIDLSGKSNDDWAGVQFDKRTVTAQRDDAGYMLYIRGNGSTELYTGKDGVLKKTSIEGFADKKAHIKIVTDEGKISIYINNGQAPAFEVEDDSYDYGYFSMVNYGNGNVSYDNLKITAGQGNGGIKKIVMSTPGDSIAIGVGETVKINVTAIPSNADNSDIVWSVTDVYGNPSVLASISDDGYLTAGQATGAIRINAKSASNPAIYACVDMAIVNEATLQYEAEMSTNRYVCDFSDGDADYVAYRAANKIEDGTLKLLATGITMTNLENHVWNSAVYEWDMDLHDAREWAGFMICKTNPADIWDHSGYMFIVTPSGDWQLLKGGNGTVRNGHLDGFVNEYNHYKIEKTGPAIAIYINSEEMPIVTFEDDTYGTGYVSFVASTPWDRTDEAWFDNIKIVPKEEDSTKTTVIESLYITGEYGTGEVACGKSLQITTCTSPYVNTDGILNWSVTPSNLAVIDENGVLTAGDNEGEVTVTATTDEGITAQTKVKISKSVKAESVYAVAQKNRRIMGVGKTVSMNAYCYPYGADDAQIVWSVMNTDESETDLAVITQDGKLTANAAGTVRVRAALKSSPEVYSDYIMTIGEVTTDGKKAVKSMNLSFFTHYVAGLTATKDGKVVSDANEIANAFDAEAFADEMAAMGAEYIVFTAYHYAMVCLYDSQVMKDWGMTGHYTDRDMIGDMIDAVNARGINVVLYVHPFDGYDFATEEEGIKTGWGTAVRGKNATSPYYDKDFNHVKWNNFINDIYGEVMEKYGDRICGIWSDEGNLWEGMAKAVDFPRLLKTIYGYNPNISTIQNNHGFDYGFDYSTWESWKMPELNDVTGNSMRTYAYRIPNPVISTDWWAGNRKTSENTVKLSGNILYRYQAMQAGANIGGGIQWSAGCYAGEGAEYQSGVTETMEIMNAYLNPVSWTIKNTLASTSYVTKDNKTFQNVGWGVATKSTDDTKEYLHILCPDSDNINGNTITLPAPEDYKVFEKAYLAVNNHPVTIEQTEDALILTLADGDTWNDTDTVIELLVDEEKTKENQENHNRPDTPNTGDMFHGSIWVYTLIILLAGISLVTVTLKVKKSNV